jgi:hypothetical protein
VLASRDAATTSEVRREHRARMAARRLVALGATEVRDVDEEGFSWTVLNDPEGNEFDVY